MKVIQDQLSNESTLLEVGVGAVYYSDTKPFKGLILLRLSLSIPYTKTYCHYATQKGHTAVQWGCFLRKVPELRLLMRTIILHCILPHGVVMLEWFCYCSRREPRFYDAGIMNIGKKFREWIAG